MLGLMLATLIAMYLLLSLFINWCDKQIKE